MSESRMLIFDAGGIRCGIDISHINEIVNSNFPEVIALQNTPDSIAGILNLRGEIITVMDVRKRLGLHTAQDEQFRIIVVENQGDKTGLLVDNVDDIINVCESSVKPLPQNINGEIRKYFQYVYEMDKEIIAIINFEELFALDNEEYPVKV